MDRFDNFKKVKVLVVGDVMLDKYMYGDVNRISPEAPVPVVQLRKTDFIPGGAANVAANISGLGATPYLVGIVGDDYEGDLFSSILKGSGTRSDSLIKIQNRQTTIKTRIMAHNQQIVRIDHETTAPLSSPEEELVWKTVRDVLERVDVIILSDYNKGLLSQRLVSRLIKLGNQSDKIILVDPKGKDYTKYTGATMITPNKFEIAEVCGINGEEDSINAAGQHLLSTLNLRALLVTRGENGMTLLEAEKKPLHLKALARHVYDVTGAGDTVIASLAVAVGAGESFSKAAEIANIAAGLVVEEIGTTSVKIEKLRTELAKPASP